MAEILLNNVFADFPIFNSNTRSIKAVLDIATGGRILGGERVYPVVGALNDVSFKIKEGDRVGLIGHNGSGKSTLLRLLNGVYEPSVGEAIITGSRQSLLDINMGIDLEATGRENIYIYCGIKLIPRKEVDINIQAIIDFAELGEFIDLPVRTYSSGMQLRLAFSIATFWPTDVLLMDEWISVGDENFAAKAEVRLKRLVDSSKILVIASHSRAFLTETCNRIIWLEHGSVKLDGTPQDVLEQYFT